MLVQAIEAAGRVPGDEIAIAVDPASSEFYRDGSYVLAGEGRTLSSDEMVDYWVDLVGRYPIVSVEDGMAEDDWDGWAALTRRSADPSSSWVTTSSSPTSRGCSRGIDAATANAILIKVNQIGTLTETLGTMALATRSAYACVMSHRSGETEDTTIADLAVATNCGQIKTGAPGTFGPGGQVQPAPPDRGDAGRGRRVPRRVALVGRAGRREPRRAAHARGKQASARPRAASPFTASGGGNGDGGEAEGAVRTRAGGAGTATVRPAPGAATAPGRSGSKGVRRTGTVAQPSRAPGRPGRPRRRTTRTTQATTDGDGAGSTAEVRASAPHCGGGGPAPTARIPVIVAVALSALPGRPGSPLSNLLHQRQRDVPADAQLARVHQQIEPHGREAQLTSKTEIERWPARTTSSSCPARPSSTCSRRQAVATRTAATGTVPGDPADQPLVPPADAQGMTPDPNRPATPASYRVVGVHRATGYGLDGVGHATGHRSTGATVRRVRGARCAGARRATGSTLASGR